MTKKIVRTGDVADFFARARDAARRADHGGSFDGTVTLSFEGSQRLRSSLLEGAQSQISGLADKKYFSELRSEVMRRLPTRF